MDDIIGKYLTQEITADEQKMLDRWLAVSPENRQYFAQMQQIWQRTEAFVPVLSRSVDTEAALEKTKTRLRNAETFRQKSRRSNFWWAAAAVFMSVLGAVLFFPKNENTSPLELAAEKNTRRDTLADGSAIALNLGSKMTVDFSGKTRQVRLRGEAFFKVAPDKTKPFRVAVRNLDITVVGTEFNVDNRSDSSLVVVQVSEGRVQVQSGGEILLLSVGDQVVFDCRTGKMTASKMSPAAAPNAWLERRFDFDETPLSEVLPLLEKAYNVRISLKNKDLSNCKLYTRFRGEPIERVVEVLAETFSLTVERVGEGYVLDGKNCE